MSQLSGLNVAVLMGGISSEHDVSLRSGAMVLECLNASEKYHAYPVIISKQNKWFWPDDIHSSPFPLDTLKQTLISPPPSWNQALFPLFSSLPQADIYFIALHGLGGEDGRLQGFLDLCQIPYTGSRMTGSALAMDKVLAKETYISHFIPTAPYAIHPKNAQIIPPPFGYPCVVKNPWGGSSIGTKIVQDGTQFRQALEELKDIPYILIEKYISGTEATCGFLDGGPVLPPTEIIPPQSTFFDYTSKYDGKSTRELTPGRFSPALTAQLQNLAKECHRALRLSGASRTDFIISNESVTVLETNTLPGLTQQSLLPQAASVAGLSFFQLLDFLIEKGLSDTWRLPT